MATVPSGSNTTTPTTAFRLEHLSHLSNQKKLGLILAAAAVIALLVGAMMWSQTPDYRVLYNNVSDQDGAAIISSLQQMNMPYKFSDNGGSILIPDKQVHEVRLKLAGQGLPKGGLPGFELMENQKFGSSQFLEQVNYQRALEGELARSVQSLSAVQSARVHLAIAKPSVFSREKQQPSVSVLLNLHPGRVLSVDQVSAIVHLMSSSVPNLPTKNVTVVDQNGNLLSTQNDNKQDKGLDVKQLQYLQELEDSYIRRIEAILTPITGAANVRAQVTADLDFSRIERAEEIYRPNNTETEAAAIRSQQTSEATSVGPKMDGGIPGALSNRPPEPAAAPIEANKEGGDKKPVVPTDQKKESTTNYEVDKTVQHTQQATGNIKRITAAVVVNYRKKINENGEVTNEPLTAEEINEINSLVKEAMGYNEKRGDSLTVTNSLFTADNVTVLDTEFWKDPENIMLAKEIVKQLLIGALVLFFLLKILRPFLKSLMPPPVPALPGSVAGEAIVGQLAENIEEKRAKEQKVLEETLQKREYEENLKKAKQIAVDQPAIVASVVKEWVSGNG